MTSESDGVPITEFKCLPGEPSALARDSSTHFVPGADTRNFNRRDCSAISVGAAGIAGASTCFLLRLTRSGRFCLRQMSASSIVATPHCGACSFSDDLTSDGISATGCPQRFAPLGHRFPHSPRTDRSFQLTSEPMRFPPLEVIGSSPRSPLK